MAPAVLTLHPEIVRFSHELADVVGLRASDILLQVLKSLRNRAGIAPDRPNCITIYVPGNPLETTAELTVDDATDSETAALAFAHDDLIRTVL